MPTNASTLAAQGRTLIKAKNHREPWSQVEVDLLLECADEKVEVIAEVLERTLYAVTNARYLLAHGQPLGGGHGTVQVSTSRTRAYTFIGDDVPPGYRD